VFTRKSRAAVLIALGLMLAVAAPASARPRDSSRVVTFGSQIGGALVHGQLGADPSQVFPGGYVAFTAIARNGGTQNLTHATFGIGTLAAANPGTSAASLPAGWTIFSITPSAGSCTLDGNVGAMCELGALVGKTGQVSVAVVLHAATESSEGIWASFKVAEQVNDNGANGDTWHAASNVSTSRACGAPAQTKLPGNVEVHVEYNTNNCGASQSSSADMIAGGFTSASLKQLSTGPNCRAGGGAECFGDYTTVDIPVVSGGAVVEWTVTWSASVLSRNFKLSRLGVIHFPDSGPAVKIDAINACSDASDVDCTVAFGTTADGDVFMTFRTNENGAAKGYG
jgi:hypothetical protein